MNFDPTPRQKGLITNIQEPDIWQPLCQRCRGPSDNNTHICNDCKEPNKHPLTLVYKPQEIE